MGVYAYCSICKSRLEVDFEDSYSDPYEAIWFMQPCNKCKSSMTIAEDKTLNPPSSVCDVCSTQLVVESTREYEDYEDGCKGLSLDIFVHPCEKCCAPE